MITIEQIDEFRKRTNSSYEDAKVFLERNNGDILEAIIDFEKTKTGKAQNFQQKKHQEDFGKRFADILQKGFDTRIFVEDKNATLFTVPVILLIILIPFWVLVLLFFVFLMLLGYKFAIRNVKSQNINVRSFFQDVNGKMKESGMNKDKPQGRDQNPNLRQTQANETQVPATSNINTPVASEVPKPQHEPDKDEGYKEYTIE